MAPYHVHSPKLGRDPTPAKLFMTLPPHTTMARHHVHSLKVGRHPLHPTIARYTRTLEWHHIHPKVGPQP